jgi:carbon storage regulator
MLCITRVVGEGIVINGNIKIIFMGLQRGQIRLGIEAPRDIPVHRLEIQHKIEENARLGIVYEKIPKEPKSWSI